MSSAAPPKTRTYNLGSIEQVPVGEGRRFQVGSMAVAVFRTREGRVLATQSLCPHKSGPLADGVVGAGKIVCPLHAYKFDLATGAPIGNACQALTTYPVSLTETGDILLDLGGQRLPQEGGQRP